MALDQKTRSQLLKARENIGAELTQLEAAAVDPYDVAIAYGQMPDCRDVYADLQRQLHEIDTLLGGDGQDAEVEAKSAYQPMVRWFADGTVGNPVRPTKAGIVLGLITVGFTLLILGAALLRALAE